MTLKTNIRVYGLGLAVVLALCTPLAAADVDAEIPALERALIEAKAAFAADPGSANQQALERAENAYQASLPAPNKNAATRAIVTEVEPNDTAVQATAVTAGDAGVGTINPAGDIDWWVDAGATAGDLVFAYVDTQNSAGTDSQINVYNDDTTTLIVFDDDGGPGLSSCAAGTVAQTGSVYYRVNEFGDNGTIDPYELYQVVVAPGLAAAEIEPNDDTTTATPITAPVMTGATAASLGDLDYFSFPANAGDVIAVICNEDPEGDGNDPDTDLDIFDTDGLTVLGGDDGNSSQLRNCAGAVTAINTGTHYVRVQDPGTLGTDITYTLTVVVNGGPVPVELMSFSAD